MKETIYYLGYYAIADEEKRYFAPAAVTKMNYIIDVLVRNGYDVQLISPSQTTIKTLVTFSSKKESINDHVELKLPFTFGGNGKIYKLVKYMWINLWLFYTLLHLKKSDIIIAYHTLDTSLCIKLAKKIKKFNVILECEEVYNDVTVHKIFNRRYETNYFKYADAYIFPTEILEKKVNTNKPFIIIYGSYQLPNLKKNSFNDEKIHVVYSGTLAPKKGVTLAMESAKYLGAEYKMHILGFGTDDEVKEVLSKIHHLNAISDCKIKYEGLLLGNQYMNFLNKCDIGLCTQEKGANFNSTSFPSKILSYLNNDLSVIAINLPSLKASKLNNYLIYYEDDSPLEVAKTIKSSRNNKINGSAVAVIKKLDKQVTNEINELIIAMKGS